MSGFSGEEITALAIAFRPGPAASALLTQSGFPPEDIPSLTGVTGHQFWSQISEALAYGVLEDGRIRILTTALQRYKNNPVFKRGIAGSAGGMPGQLRLLVVGAGLGASTTASNGSTRPTRPIRADQESRLLIKLQELGHLEVELRPAATIDDLTFDRARPPDILHLICHGDGETLVFADELGDPRRVPATAVAELIAAYGVHLRGIVLNACYSAACAGVFALLTDTVIAHTGAVDDDCARLYAEQLYRCLRTVPDLGEAATIAATHLAVGDAQCPEIRDGLVVLTKDGRP